MPGERIRLLRMETVVKELGTMLLCEIQSTVDPSGTFLSDGGRSQKGSERAPRIQDGHVWSNPIVTLPLLSFCDTWWGLDVYRLIDWLIVSEMLTPQHDWISADTLVLSNGPMLCGESIVNLLFTAARMHHTHIRTHQPSLAVVSGVWEKFWTVQCFGP